MFRTRPASKRVSNRVRLTAEVRSQVRLRGDLPLLVLAKIVIPVDALPVDSGLTRVLGASLLLLLRVCSNE